MSYWLIGRHRDRRIEHRLEAGAQTVGRSNENDLQLPSQTVSRVHASLVLDGDALLVEDLGSLNGTRINGELVYGAHSAAMDDRIEFGSVVLRLTDPDAMSLGTLTDEQDLTASVQIPKEESGGRAVKFVATDERLLTLVINTCQLVVDPSDRQQTFEQVVDLVYGAIPAERVLLLQKDDDDILLQRVARVEGRPENTPIQLSRRMVTQVVDHGASILTTGNADFDSSDTPHARSAMAVPLVHNDHVMGALYVDASSPDIAYTDRDLHVLSILGQMLGTKIDRANLLEQERERDRLNAELALAAGIQKGLLPRTLPEIPGYELYGTQDTCEAVGGDLYDSACTEAGRCQIILGDVSGKGMGAALLMANAMGAIRVLRDMDVPLEELVMRLDRDIIVSTQDEHFITMFLAEIDTATHTLEYINAGHPAAFLVSPRGRLTPLTTTGFAVGVNLERPSGKFQKRVTAFPPGAALVVYSDGVTEAQAGEKFFGDERLKRVLEKCGGKGPAEIVDCVLDAVDRFTTDEAHSDDVTMFVACRSG